MTPVTDHSSSFGKQPSVAAPCRWLPVYLEPLSGSGERITVAVAARAADGTYHVRQTFDARAVRCLYGPRADNVAGTIGLIVDSLNAHLAAGAELSNWKPPLGDGVYLGTVADAYDDNARVVADVGTALTSSVAAQQATLASTLAARHPERGDEWTQLIRAAIAQRHEGWATRFEQSIRLRDGAPPTRFGYIGTRLAAQFGRLVPGRGLVQSRRAAKAYVTDLQILREHEKLESLIPRQNYELMLWLPDADNVAFSAAERDEAQGAFAELEAFGDRNALRVVDLHTSDAAATRIERVELGA